MYSVSDAAIVNMALDLVGSPYDAVVTAVDGTDTSKWGQWAGRWYQHLRNAELRLNEWKFAVQRAALGSATKVTNLTGFWYAYAIPTDCLFTLFLYSILPQWVMLYPRKYLHIVMTPYIVEDQYYTDMDPTNGNPYVKYIKEMPLGTLWTDQNFVDMMVMRVASKMLPPATANLTAGGIAQQYMGEYGALLERAKGRNAMDKEDDLPDSGQILWSDRGRWSGNWGSGGD
jgi:hypothetical protein